MTNRNYMEKLLALCTEAQKELFGRMYPNCIPDNSQLKTAINQIENTLKNLNCSEAELIQVKENHKKELEEYAVEKNVDTDKLNELNKELTEANRRIQNLSNPVSTQGADIQERLDFLEALEACGVIEYLEDAKISG